MVDGSKVGSMIVMVIIGIIIIILGGIVIWKYRQDQALFATMQANGTLTAAQVAALPKAGWVYGLAGLQIVLGIILVIWGIVQYFSGHKYVDAIKEYASRTLAPHATTVVEPGVPNAVPIETKTTYAPAVANPIYTGGSRRAVRVA